MDLEYTITKFDADNKIVVVTFKDDSWAELRLINPLPKNIQELEGHIRHFAPPVEAIQARLAPDADLSYIAPLVGDKRITARLELNPPQQIQANAEPQTIDPEVEANLKMWEEVEFQKRVGEALVKFGIVSTNPMVIPVTTA
jgi:hypothetical protein